MKKIAMIAAMVALTCADGHAQGLLNRLGRVLDKAVETVDRTMESVLGGSSDAAQQPTATPAPAPTPAPAATPASPSAPASQQADNLITAAGAGVFRFGAIKPGKIGDYAVEKVVDEEWGDEYTFVKDTAGEIAISYYPDYMMEIFSPDFRLENGIRTGMTMSEVLQIMGSGWNPEIDEGWNDDGRTIEFSKNIGLKGMSLTEKAQAAWNEAYAKGGDFQLKLTDFEPAGTVQRIVVRSE